MSHYNLDILVTQMRAKSIAVFLTVLVALVTLCVVQVDYAFYSEQVNQNEAAARGQMGALVPSVLSESQRLVDTHRALIGPLAAKGGDFSEAISTKIEMYAVLKSQAAGDWAVSQKIYFEKTNVKSWAESYMLLALKAVKPADLVQGGVSLLALLDPQRAVYFLWLVRDSDSEWTAIVTKADVFQSLMDRLKGQSSSAIILNRQGQILGHTTTEYVGAMMSDDPLLSEIVKSGKKSGNKLYKDANTESAQGFYEQVPYSNIFVAMTRPLRASEKARQSLRWQILLLGFGLGLVGVAVLYMVSKTSTPMMSSTSIFSPVAAATVNSVASTPLIVKTEIAKEKMKAYTESAMALGRELHAPFNRILAHSQVMKSSAQAPDENLDRIESLARQGKDTILKLLQFSGEETYRIEPTSLVESLTHALDSIAERAKAEGVLIESELKRMPEVAANHVAVTRLVTEVLKNALDAVAKVSYKKIIVRTEAMDPWIVVRVIDSGEGVPVQDQEKIFDPFFSKRGSSSHSGLGLSVVQGLMHEFNGHVQIRSEVGKGSTVELRFPAAPSGLVMKAVEKSAPAKPLVVPPVLRAPSESFLAKAVASSSFPAMPSAPSEILDLLDSKIESPPLQSVSISPLASGHAPPLNNPLPPMSGKIDKPKFDVQKKEGKLDLASVTVRRPGERK